MQQFFSKILIKKKIFAFFVLFFIVSGIILPNVAHGQLVPVLIFKKIVEYITADDCDASKLSYLQSTEVSIPNAIVWGSKEIADWSTSLSSWIIDRVKDWPITNTSTGDAGALAFMAGWTSTRDLANMLVVLGFVVVGIATALRIREYEAKNFLWKLIIVALLINFSGLFCGLIIDGSNITMKGLLGLGNGTSGMGASLFDTVSKAEQGIWCQNIKAKDAVNIVASDIFFACIYLAIAFAFLYLAIILIARYAVLGILFILSPLAFVFYAFPFPKAKDLWNQWWGAFLKWAFIGISICFFLNLAGNILNGFPIGPNFPNADTSTIIFYLAIVLMVIIVGIKISSKQSGVGALASTAIMGLATGGAGLAMGAVGKVGGAIAERTGATRAASAVKSKALQLGEKMRLVTPGTSTRGERTATDNYKKEFSRLNNQQITDNLNKSAVYTREGVRQRAALAEMAVERGVFDPNNARHVAGLKNAQSKGFTLTPEQIDKDPRLAPLDAGTMANIKKTKGLTGAAASEEATKQTVTGMSPKEAREKLRAGPLGDINVTKHMTLEQTDGMEFASPKKRAALKDFAVGGSKETEFNSHILSTTDPVRQKELTDMQAKFGTF